MSLLLEKGKTPLRQIQDGQPMTDPCFYRLESTAERKSALISRSVRDRTEYYANQNDERRLPQAIHMLRVSNQWNLRLIIAYT